MSIEIVCSPIAKLSSMSNLSRLALLKVLKSKYESVVITLVTTPQDLDDIAARKPDLVFLGTKKMPGAENGLGFYIWIEEYLMNLGVSCTGSGSNAHKLELNKSLAKQRVLDVGLNTSPFYVVYQNNPSEIVTNTLTYPLFIKPTDRGGGLGIDRYSVVHNISQLDSKVHSISTLHDSDSLVEQYLSGREFSVAIMRKLNTNSYLVMPIEITAPKNTFGTRLLSSKVKSADSEEVFTIKEGALKNVINTLALAVFHALGARDYGRIDIRLDENGTPQFLEANLLPSLIENYGSFPKACLLNERIDYPEMIINIVELGLSRVLISSRATTTFEIDSA